MAPLLLPSTVTNDDSLISNPISYTFSLCEISRFQNKLVCFTQTVQNWNNLVFHKHPSQCKDDNGKSAFNDIQFSGECGPQLAKQTLCVPFCSCLDISRK